MEKSWPHLISINQLADLTGKDRRTITARLSTIEPVKGPKNSHLYELPAALPKIFENFDDEGESTGLRSAQVEKAALDRARRIAVELDTEIKRKNLIPREDLKTALEKTFAVVRAKLLALPDKAAQTFQEDWTRKELKESLKDLSRECAQELSEARIDDRLTRNH